MRRPDGIVVKTMALRGPGRVVGSAIAAVSLLLFVMVTAAVLSDSAGVAAVDALAARALAQHLSATAREFLSLVSALHAPRGILALTMLAAVALLWRRDSRGLLLLLAVVPVGATLNHLLKHTIQRPRPGLEHAVDAVTDFGFPSGHAANATLLYGCVAVLLVPHLRSRGARIAFVLAAVLAAALVSCSRVALGAHRLSDVVAGMLLGIAWLALCLVLAGTLPGAHPPD